MSWIIILRENQNKLISIVKKNLSREIKLSWEIFSTIYFLADKMSSLVMKFLKLERESLKNNISNL